MGGTIMHYVHFAVCAAVLFLLSGCKEQKAAAPSAPVFVQTVDAETIEYRPRFTLMAELKPYRKLELIPRVSGFLVERNFREGEFVKAGTVLYRIQKESYELAVRQAEVAKARANELNAQLEFDRAQKLYQENVAAPKRFDTARAGLQSAVARRKAAEAQLGQAKLDLGYTEISAPFDGLIGFTSTDVGNYIGTPSKPLAELVDVDRMRVEFNLSDRYLTERMVRDLINGQIPAWTVTLKLPDGSEYSHKGEIRFWSNQVNPSSATLRMQAVFPNPERSLIGGLYGTVTLTAPETVKAVQLDARALLHEVNGSFVYVVGVGDIVEFRPVLTGIENERSVILRKGLRGGEKVILAGNPRVRPGVRVTVAPEKAEPHK